MQQRGQTNGSSPAERALARGRRDPAAASVAAGERVGRASAPQARNRGAEPLHQPPCDRVGGGDGRMLADDRADAGLEGIPCPRRTKARTGSERGPMTASRGEMRRGLVEIEVEAGDPAGARDEVDESLPVR